MQQRKRCRHPGGAIVKPDGIHPLLPCVMEDKEIHRNVTVIVRQCPTCGHVEITWNRQEDTEDEIISELGSIPDDN